MIFSRRIKTVVFKSNNGLSSEGFLDEIDRIKSHACPHIPVSDKQKRVGRYDQFEKSSSGSFGFYNRNRRSNRSDGAQTADVEFVKVVVEGLGVGDQRKRPQLKGRKFAKVVGSGVSYSVFQLKIFKRSGIGFGSSPMSAAASLVAVFAERYDWICQNGIEMRNKIHCPATGSQSLWTGALLLHVFFVGSNRRISRGVVCRKVCVIDVSAVTHCQVDQFERNHSLRQNP